MPKTKRVIDVGQLQERNVLKAEQLKVMLDDNIQPRINVLTELISEKNDDYWNNYLDSLKSMKKIASEAIESNLVNKANKVLAEMLTKISLLELVGDIFYIYDSSNEVDELLEYAKKLAKTESISEQELVGLKVKIVWIEYFRVKDLVEGESEYDRRLENIYHQIHYVESNISHKSSLIKIEQIEKRLLRLENQFLVSEVKRWRNDYHEHIRSSRYSYINNHEAFPIFGKLKSSPKRK